MVVMTCQDDHRIRGQLMGLTKSTTDEPSITDETILMDEPNITDKIILMDKPKQMPPSLMKVSGPFNTASNTSDGYNNSYADR